MKKQASFLLLLVSFSACLKVGPDFVPPCVPETSSWKEAGPNVVVEEEGPLMWWNVFEDPTLNQLLQIGYDNNLSLEIACFRIQEARYALAFAIGKFFPQTQQMFGTFTRQRLSKNQPNTGPAPNLQTQNYLLGFEAVWELDFWGKYRRAIESEEMALLASFANYDDVLLLLLSDIAAVYIDLCTLQEQLSIVMANQKIQQRSLEIATAQFEGGFVSELDVQQATTFLKGTEARIPDLVKNFQIKQHALALLLGITPEELSSYVSLGKKLPHLPKTLFVSCPEDLLLRRPDLKEAYYQTAAQSARIGIATADFFPQISLTGTLGLNSSGNSTNNVNMSSGHLLSRDSLTFNYGWQFIWPLLNYGRIYSRMQLETMRFYQLVVAYQNKVLNAYREVEDGLSQYQLSFAQSLVLEESVQAAQRAVELSNEQYVEGLVDYTTVLTTQQALLSEQEKYVLARGQIALGVINTYKALGGGWEVPLIEAKSSF